MNRNIFILSGLAVYTAAATILTTRYGAGIGELLFIVAVFGPGFSALAIACTKNISTPNTVPPKKMEPWILMALLAWIILFITFLSNGIKYYNSAHSFSEPLKAVIVLLCKLLAFVAVPYCIYRIAGFKTSQLLPANYRYYRRIILSFVVISTATILFQLYCSKGGRSFLHGAFNHRQLWVGIPVSFIWLIAEAGIVEEFFFRVVLQSRIAALTKSGTGAIVWTALIFGVVHAPGLYLRGAESEDISGQMPFLYWVCFTICYMSVAGFFLGVLWHRTKNFLLLTAVHAMFDLLPNFKEFIEVWNIQ
jgi:uncharacterized protein